MSKHSRMSEAKEEKRSAFQNGMRSAAAGACAGTVTKTIVAPMERIKMLFQVARLPISPPPTAATIDSRPKAGDGWRPRSAQEFRFADRGDPTDRAAGGRVGLVPRCPINCSAHRVILAAADQATGPTWLESSPITRSNLRSTTFSRSELPLLFARCSVLRCCCSFRTW